MNQFISTACDSIWSDLKSPNHEESVPDGMNREKRKREC
jgi:hypothetical protein